MIDEDTYVQQGLDLHEQGHVPMLHYILDTLGVKPDLLMLGWPVTDEFSHQFLGLIVPKSPQGGANPLFDDVNGTGTKDHRIGIRRGYIQSAYHGADSTLGLARGLVGGDPTVLASSDHGFAPQWLAINAGKVLFDAGLRSGQSALDADLRGADDGGPGIREQHRKLPGVQAVDLAPTAASLLGIPAPANTQGRVLSEILGSH